jgi:hypothetical protein
MSRKQVVTPQFIENAPAFRRILDAGNGVPSSDSELGSIAVAGLINWWGCCAEGENKASSMADDVNRLIVVLLRFKQAVAANPAIVSPTFTVVNGYDDIEERRSSPFPSLADAVEHARVTSALSADEAASLAANGDWRETDDFGTTWVRIECPAYDGERRGGERLTA